MKSEVSVKPTVVHPKSDPVPPMKTRPSINTPDSTPEVKTTKRKLPPTPATSKQS